MSELNHSNYCGVRHLQIVCSLQMLYSGETAHDETG